MARWAWCAGSPSVLVTVISRAMSSLDGVMMEMSPSLMAQRSCQWVTELSQAPLADSSNVAPTFPENTHTLQVVHRHPAYWDVSSWSRTCIEAQGCFCKCCLGHSLGWWSESVQKKKKERKIFLNDCTSLNFKTLAPKNIWAGVSSCTVHANRGMRQRWLCWDKVS